MRLPGPVRAAWASRFAATAFRVSHTGATSFRASLFEARALFQFHNSQHRGIERVAMIRAQEFAGGRPLSASLPGAGFGARARIQYTFSFGKVFGVAVAEKERRTTAIQRRIAVSLQNGKSEIHYNGRNYLTGGLLPAAAGWISTITLQSTGGDSFPFADTAATPMRCLPTPNSIRGLVAEMPFTAPLEPAGAGIENSLYAFAGLEMSYTIKVLTHASFFVFSVHKGLCVKS